MRLLKFYPQLTLFRDALRPDCPRTFLVGGALRDYYLNKGGGLDFDFAVEKGAVALSRKLARRLKGAFVLLDEEHGSARVVKKIDGRPVTFDLTDWRGSSIKKDLKLRDFTINALAADIFKDNAEILDVQNSRRDLEKGMVRMVSPKAFKDDPLRLLRAFSLQAGLGFKIEAHTRAQIKKDAHLIADAAAERIREEIFKVLSAPQSYPTLVEMDRIGLLSRVIPQIDVMKGVKQGGFHHLDVWKHSLDMVQQLEKIVAGLDDKPRAYLEEIIGGAHTRLSLLKMAVLLHDIGKPETAKQEGKRFTFHGHEHAGERITRLVAKQLKVSVHERYFLENAVRMHLRPGYLSNFKRPSAKAVFRYLRDTKDEAASVAILAMADQAATRGPLTTRLKVKHHTKICRMLIDRYFGQREEKPVKRLLTGHDLIKILKLQPSPLFGKILKTIEEEAALGRIRTKEEALALARKESA